jgi:hypothetical protein
MNMWIEKLNISRLVDDTFLEAKNIFQMQRILGFDSTSIVY